MATSSGRLRHKLTQFRALEADRKREFLSCWVNQQLLAARFAVFGFKRTAAMIKRKAAKAASVDPLADPLEVAIEMTRIVDAAARNSLAGKNCLRESLMLWLVLKKRGIEAELHIGAPSNPQSQPKWEAHAWIELDGQVLNDKPNVAKRYSRFCGFAEAWNSL